MDQNNPVQEGIQISGLLTEVQFSKMIKISSSTPVNHYRFAINKRNEVMMTY